MTPRSRSPHEPATVLPNPPAATTPPSTAEDPRLVFAPNRAEARVTSLVLHRDRDRTLPSQCDFRFHGREPTIMSRARVGPTMLYKAHGDPVCEADGSRTGFLVRMRLGRGRLIWAAG